MSPIQNLSTSVHQALADKGVPEDRRSGKIQSLWWYAPAVLLLLIAVAFCGIAVWYLFDHTLDISSAIVLLAPAALCSLGALVCATQADAEALEAAVEVIGKLVRFGRG